jgi:DNA-binding response OmpR family regulator
MNHLLRDNKQSMKCKILYVEDELETRKNISSFIKNNYDITVLEANNGKEGLESYHKNKPNILITDLFMGKFDGFEMIEEIREVDTEIKIIILSAYSEKEKLLRAIKLDLVEYLIKPVSRKQLRDSLNNTLNILSDNNIKKRCYFNNNSYFDLDANLLLINDINVKITKTEIILLNLFIDNPKQTLESVDIYSNVWNFEKDYKVESVRTLIKKIRKKLPENAIINIYGGGYKLNLQ